MDGAPLFNNDVQLFVSARESACCGSNWTQYLTISEGHVIKHAIDTVDCVARFANDQDAKATLTKAGWWENNGRFYPEKQDE